MKPKLLNNPELIKELENTPWGSPVNTPKQVYEEPRVVMSHDQEYTGDMTIEEYLEKRYAPHH